MYMAYNKVLRILSDNRGQNEKQYVTTIHAIVSGIIKLVCVCVCVYVCVCVCVCVVCVCVCTVRSNSGWPQKIGWHDFLLGQVLGVYHQ